MADGPYPNDPAAELPGPYWSPYDFLAQSEWWKPRDLAAAVRVESLDPDHQRRLLAFLRSRAPRLALGYVDEAYQFLSMCRGDMATYEAERICDQAIDETLDPAAWLETMPLIVRLRELTEQRRVAGDGPEWWEATSPAMTIEDLRTAHRTIYQQGSPSGTQGR